MAEEIPVDFENGRLLSMPHDFDLDLGSGHMAYHHASLIYLYLHTKFHLCMDRWMDGRTYIRTDRHGGRLY